MSKIGTHISYQSHFDPTVSSPDVLARALGLDIRAVSGRLSAAYSPGDRAIRVADPRPFQDGPFWGITSGTAIARDATGRGSFRFDYTIANGTDLLQIRSILGTATACEPGSQVDRLTPAWANDQVQPVAPSFLTTDGRDTGYPAGLKPGQRIQLIALANPATPAEGLWTLTARGTTTLLVTARAKPVKQFRFVRGVCEDPTAAIPCKPGDAIAVVVLESSPDDPAHDIRLIIPGGDPETGASFVEDYANHADDPAYFRWHPDYLDAYRPYAVLRDSDNGVNNRDNPSSTTDWSTRNPATQRPGYFGNRGLPVEQEVQLANATGRDLWLCLPPLATDDYAINLGRYLRDHLRPGIKVYAEWALEVWNWQYGHHQHAVAMWGIEAAGLSGRDLSSVRADASSRPISPGSLQFTVGPEGLRASFGAAKSGLRDGDTILITGCAVPEANGVWRCGYGTIDDASVAFWPVPLSTRPLPPGLSLGSNPIGAADGQQIQYRLLVSNGGGNKAVPQSDEAASKWSGRRHRQIHRILRLILGDVLVPVIPGWHVPGWNERILTQYAADALPGEPACWPGSILAIAPYFDVASGGLTEAAIVGWKGTPDGLLDAAFASMLAHIGRLAPMVAAARKLCDDRGIGLACYECGPHNVTQNAAVAPLYLAVARDARMGELLGRYFAMLADNGVSLACHYKRFNPLSGPDTFGASEYQGQRTAKSDALDQLCLTNNPPAVEPTDPKPTPEPEPTVIQININGTVHEITPPAGEGKAPLDIAVSVKNAPPEGYSISVGPDGKPLAVSVELAGATVAITAKS